MRGMRLPVAATLGIAGPLAWLVYDTQTCHPMRRLTKRSSGTRIKDFVRTSVVRLHNTCTRLEVLGQLRHITLDELGRLDGRGTAADGGTKKDEPLCFGCRGWVFDASSSDTFRTAYSGWAGQDATYALAAMSLRPEDAGRQDAWLDSQLSSKQL